MNFKKFKSIAFTSICFVGIASSIIACNKEKVKKEEVPPKIEKMVYLTQSSNLLSLKVQKLGVQSLELIHSSDSTEIFKIHAVPMGNYNGIDGYSIDNRVLSFKAISSNELKMTYEDGKSIVLNTESVNTVFNFDGKIISSDNPNFDSLCQQFMSPEIENEFGWGVYILKEVFDDNLVRMPELNQVSGEWGLIGIHFSRSYTYAHLKALADRFLLNNPNCHMVGGIDISCLTDNHWCFGTVVFDCGNSSTN